MERLSQTKINEMIEKHTKWLNDEEGGEQLILKDVKLEGVIISDVDLTLSIISDVMFNKCRLYNVTIDDISSSKLNFYGGTLTKVHMNGGNIIDSSYENLIIKDCDIVSSNLLNTSLLDVKVMDSMINFNDLTDSYARETAFERNEMVANNFSATTFLDVAFTDVNLQGCSFSHARFETVKFIGDMNLINVSVDNAIGLNVDRVCITGENNSVVISKWRDLDFWVSGYMYHNKETLIRDINNSGFKQATVEKALKAIEFLDTL